MACIRRLTVLMILVVLVLTGFQLYWLRDNYRRERISLGIRASNIFEETITRLQDSILQKKLGIALQDSTKINKHQTIYSHTRRLNDSINLEYRDVDNTPRTPPITIQDTNKFFMTMDANPPQAINQVLVVEADDAKVARNPELIDRRLTGHVRGLSQSVNIRGPGLSGIKSGSILFKNGKGQNIAIKLDSLLTDSIPLDIVANAFGRGLKQRKIEIPFSISLADVNVPSKVESPGNELFSRNSRYVYRLQDRYVYLAKKISLPILFSFFLIGITITSFILLYLSLRQQQRLAQSRSDLVNNITHELKTPIATVSVAIEALKNFSGINNKEKTEEYLNISQQELVRLGLLVDKVLKLSMFESKDLLLNKERINLGDLVKDVAASLRLQLEKSNTDLKITTEGDLEIHGDRQHLQSIIFNLLDNSLKYNEGNLIEIKTHVKGEKDRVELTISDNGIGIPEMYHKKIFEKFFRVPTGDMHNAKGHGLGLSYVASVVKQHGGTITVQSKEQLGSSFTIILPK